MLQKSVLCSVIIYSFESLTLMQILLKAVGEKIVCLKEEEEQENTQNLIYKIFINIFENFRIKSFLKQIALKKVLALDSFTKKKKQHLRA